jgi:hypothetical protein
VVEVGVLVTAVGTWREELGRCGVERVGTGVGSEDGATGFAQSRGLAGSVVPIGG